MSISVLNVLLKIKIILLYLKHRHSSLTVYFALTAFSLGGVPKVHSEPEQAWAHKMGVVDLQAGYRQLYNAPLKDRLLIQEMFSRWGIAYDEGQSDVTSSLFTEDAELIVFLGSDIPITTISGREKIVSKVQDALSQQNDQRRHLISNVVIQELDKGKAKALAYGVVTVAGNPIYIGASVIYSGDLVLIDGIWKFSKFVIGMDAYQDELIKVE